MTSREEKDLCTQDIMQAYERLSPMEKKIIDEQAKKLITAIREKTKDRVVGPSFGKFCAIELLCKLGLFCTKENIWRLD